MSLEVKYTLDQFLEFVEQPENEERLFEFIDGEIIEVPPGRTLYSHIGHIIAFAVHLFCQENHLPCYTSGGDGTYNIAGNAVAPDFAYKSTPVSDQYPDPFPPEWVVEIISPTDKAFNIRKKRQIYLNAGILYWELYVPSKSIDVYQPGHEMQIFGINDILDGGEVLPGFQLPVKDIFKT